MLTEGRGMVAMKRRLSGRGRSHVMMRSMNKSILDGPTFRPVFENKRRRGKCELVGAIRASHPLTATFKNVGR